MLRLNLSHGNGAALGNHLAVRVHVKTAVDLLGRAQRRQRLAAHVAEHAVQANKVGPVRGVGRADGLDRVLRQLGHDEAVLHPFLVRLGSSLARFICFRCPVI